MDAKSQSASPAFEMSPMDSESVTSSVLVGPIHVGEDDLQPLVTRCIAVLTAAAVGLQNAKPFPEAGKEAARQLVVSSCLLACGEARAALVLVTSALVMQARIHIRSVDELLRRVVVYGKDHELALSTYTQLDAFRRDGFRKLSKADIADIKTRNEAVAAQIEALMETDLVPPQITKHKAYERQTSGLSSFDRFAYSQIEHGTLLALRELAAMVALAKDVNLIFATADGGMLLKAVIGMLQNLILQLNGWGVDIGDEVDALIARSEKIVIPTAE